MKTLVVMNGPEKDRLLPLTQPTTVIGRNPAADHVLRDPRVESFHAILTLDACGRVNRHETSERTPGLRTHGRRLPRVVPINALIELGDTIVQLIDVPDEQIMKFVEESGERSLQPERVVYMRASAC